MRRRFFLLLVFFLIPAHSVFAQDTTSVVVKRVSPRSAFIRSLLVPGWGQFSVHANKRGAAFVALQGASWFMLIKTLNKLSDAQESEDKAFEPAADSLRARMSRDTALARQFADERAFREAVLADSTVSPAHSLVRSRQQQRQDWITYTLFTTLAGGVDAYIAAQLADFPATISAQPRPEGGVQFRVRMPTGKR